MAGPWPNTRTDTDAGTWTWDMGRGARGGCLARSELSMPRAAV